MDEIESTYLRWVDELWNKRNLDIIDELFAEDGIAYYPFFASGEEPVKGRENFKRFVALAGTKYADVSATITEITSIGFTVIALSEINARVRTEEPDWQTPSEFLHVKALCKITFSEGKITEIWNNVQVVSHDVDKRRLKFENI